MRQSLRRAGTSAGLPPAARRPPRRAERTFEPLRNRDVEGGNPPAADLVAEERHQQAGVGRRSHRWAWRTVTRAAWADFPSFQRTRTGAATAPRSTSSRSRLAFGDKPGHALSCWCLRVARPLGELKDQSRFDKRGQAERNLTCAGVRFAARPGGRTGNLKRSSTLCRPSPRRATAYPATGFTRASGKTRAPSTSTSPTSWPPSSGTTSVAGSAENDCATRRRRPPRGRRPLGPSPRCSEVRGQGPIRATVASGLASASPARWEPARLGLPPSGAAIRNTVVASRCCAWPVSVRRNNSTTPKVEAPSTAPGREAIPEAGASASACGPPRSGTLPATREARRAAAARPGRSAPPAARRPPAPPRPGRGATSPGKPPGGGPLPGRAAPRATPRPRSAATAGLPRAIRLPQPRPRRGRPTSRPTPSPGSRMPGILAAPLPNQSTAVVNRPDAPSPELRFDLVRNDSGPAPHPAFGRQQGPATTGHDDDVRPPPTASTARRPRHPPPG